MRRLSPVCLALCLSRPACTPQEAASGANERLDRQFQAAVAQYESGRFPEAATALEALLREVPESFEVHELLDWCTPRNLKTRKPRASGEGRAPEAGLGGRQNELGH